MRSEGSASCGCAAVDWMIEVRGFLVEKAHLSQSVRVLLLCHSFFSGTKMNLVLYRIPHEYYNSHERHNKYQQACCEPILLTLAEFQQEKVTVDQSSTLSFVAAVCIWSVRSKEENYQFTLQKILAFTIINTVTALTAQLRVLLLQASSSFSSASFGLFLVPKVAHQKLVNFTQGCVVDSISLGKVLLDNLYLNYRASSTSTAAGFNFFSPSSFLSSFLRLSSRAKPTSCCCKNLPLLLRTTEEKKKTSDRNCVIYLAPLLSSPRPDDDTDCRGIKRQWQFYYLEAHHFVDREKRDVTTK